MTTEPAQRQVRLEVHGDEVVLVGGALDQDRRARLFLSTAMGARSTAGGWTVHRRRRPIDEVVVSVNQWLVRHGYATTLTGVADESVRREKERRASFTRTREAARQMRRGEAHIDQAQVDAALARAGWNFTDRELMPHQVEAVVHGLTAINPANFSVPGAGKTASTLGLAAVHLAQGTIDMVVVIGPLSCFGPWETETATALPRLTPRRIRGSVTERRSRLRAMRPGNLALVSYASAAADELALIELCRTYRVMLVADESHRIKRFNGGLWAPAVVEVAKHARVRVILSGTPMPQSGKDLYTQLGVLWPGQELTGTRNRFKSRVLNDFDAVLEDVLPFVSRTPKSALGLPDPELIRHHVPMTEDEAEIYRLVRENMRQAVEAAGPVDADRLAALRRGRPLRLLQACSNPALLAGSTRTVPLGARGNPTLLSRIDDYDATSTPPSKYAAALQLLHDLPVGQKAVVWSTFVQNLDMFAGVVRFDSRFAVYQVDGRVQPGQNDDAEDDGPDTREQVIAGFLTDPGSAVLITNPASCSESISLHRACHTAIYLDRTYDCAQWLQSIDRIHRLGLPPHTTVRVHVLQAVAGDQPSADMLVDASLLAKEGLMRQLLEGAQLAPFEQAEDPILAHEGDAEDLRQLLEYLLGQGDDISGRT